jgi:hypothetical protein
MGSNEGVEVRAAAFKHLTDALNLDLLQTLGQLLAIAIIRQIDTADLVGRILGLKQDGSPFFAVLSLHSALTDSSSSQCQRLRWSI